MIAFKSFGFSEPEPIATPIWIIVVPIILVLLLLICILLLCCICLLCCVWRLEIIIKSISHFIVKVTFFVTDGRRNKAMRMKIVYHFNHRKRKVCFLFSMGN